ncbi:LOW QUALITY PROTEIN: hypothetical protein TorRG33x02_183250, partial [Trema orientale]
IYKNKRTDHVLTTCSSIPVQHHLAFSGT